MNNEFFFWITLICLPAIAFLYASVGHGGASGYLALMSILGYTQEVMKPTALFLNILVSAIAFYFFWKAGHFKFKLFLAFAIGSVPLSFIGGLINTDPSMYKVLLGLFLIIATLKLVGIFDKGKKSNSEYQLIELNFPLAIVIGCIIGFLSGLIGIGGGIILSPVILWLGWANLKQAAAVSALFIFMNSAAGFAGQMSAGFVISHEIVMMAVLAAVGGLAGSYYGTFRFDPITLKKVLAIVLLFASIKLLVI